MADSTTDTSKDRLHGTLDVLILKTLTWGPRHGYAIARWLEDTTEHTIQIEEGSLYPALYRMERKGWIEAEWGVSELGRKAKFYKITALGRRHLKNETVEWSKLAHAIALVLTPAK
jgi:PadR family transcriptional regulator PadR